MRYFILWLSVLWMVPATSLALRADISGPNDVPDCRVDLFDLAVFASEWLESEDCMGLGPELITNGGFDADTDWDKGIGWSISSGVAVWNAAIQETLSQDAAVGVKILTKYKVTFTVSGFSGAVVDNRPLFRMGGTYVFFSGDGDKSFDLTTENEVTDTIIFQGSSNDEQQSFNIDNVSVREILPGGTSLSSDMIAQFHEDE